MIVVSRKIAHNLAAICSVLETAFDREAFRVGGLRQGVLDSCAGVVQSQPGFAEEV